ncbi:Blp family class II bacteriocin, partial [Acinetobacter baumannii]
MRELSIHELDIISGGSNATDCKNDVLAGAGLGATAGAAATAWAGAWAAVGAA